MSETGGEVMKVLLGLLLVVGMSGCGTGTQPARPRAESGSSRGQLQKEVTADTKVASPAAKMPADKTEKDTGPTQGADDVVDGWVSTTNKASFSQPTLKANGYAWSSYEYVLMRFKLDRIAPSQHGRLQKAVLRLQVVSAKNPKKTNTKVAPTVGTSETASVG